jgi:hypothetical protein
MFCSPRADGEQRLNSSSLDKDQLPTYPLLSLKGLRRAGIEAPSSIEKDFRRTARQI